MTAYHSHTKEQEKRHDKKLISQPLLYVTDDHEN